MVKETKPVMTRMTNDKTLDTKGFGVKLVHRFTPQGPGKPARFSWNTKCKCRNICSYKEQDFISV